jgi:hypothetical protein
MPMPSRWHARRSEAYDFHSERAAPGHDVGEGLTAGPQPSRNGSRYAVAHALRVATFRLRAASRWTRLACRDGSLALRSQRSDTPCVSNGPSDHLTPTPQQNRTAVALPPQPAPVATPYRQCLQNPAEPTDTIDWPPTTPSRMVGYGASNLQDRSKLWTSHVGRVANTRPLIRGNTPAV